jgi:aldose 1-epimerase
MHNTAGLSVSVTDLGATVTRILVPDRSGRVADVVLGCDNAAAYLAQRAYLGATVGRVANRIDRARFELSGMRYTLYPSDPPHHLHGGRVGWDKAVWITHLLGDRSIRFQYTSPNKEEGYPGTVRATVLYELGEGLDLRVRMSATTDALTLVNMTHHGYWNLAGHDSGSVLDHELTLHASRYTPGVPIPTGEIAPVRATPLDFTASKSVGCDLPASGYDHNFVIDGPTDALRPAAFLRDPRSGRSMTLSANQPGLQLYSGNYLDGTICGKGATYRKHAGLCLETQKFPNAINVPSWREQVLLAPTRSYQHEILMQFDSG